MSKAPDKVYAKLHTIGSGIDITDDHTAYWPDIEYIRNDDEAMQAAGWVSAKTFDEMHSLAIKAQEGRSENLDKIQVLLGMLQSEIAENDDLRDKLATARNDALEEAARFIIDDSRRFSCKYLADTIRDMKETDK